MTLVFANAGGVGEDALQFGKSGIDGGRGLIGLSVDHVIGSGVFCGGPGGKADGCRMGSLAFEMEPHEVDARGFVAQNFCGLFIGMGADFVLGGESFAGEDQTGRGHIHHG